MEKAIRTQLHNIFRKWSASLLETDTVLIDDIQYFRINTRHKRNNKIDNSRKQFNNNQVVDITQLKSLNKIRFLFVQNNPLTSTECPINPKYICRFDT